MTKRRKQMVEVELPGMPGMPEKPPQFLEKGRDIWLKNTVCPCHPGEILKEFYLEPLNISISAFARNAGVSRKVISAIVNGRSSVTAKTALLLSGATNTSPQLWLNLQNNYDLWNLMQEAKEANIPMT